MKTNLQWQKADRWQGAVGGEGRLPREGGNLGELLHVSAILIVVISWLYAYDKTYQIVCFKYLLILVCLLCLRNAVFLKKHLHLLIVRAGPKQGPDRCTRASFMHSEDFIYFKRVLGWNRKPPPPTLTITSASHHFLIPEPFFVVKPHPKFFP